MPGLESLKIADQGATQTFARNKRRGDPVQPCVYMADPCCFKRIVVECSHDRAYKLIYPQPPDSEEPLELHVLAGETKADKIKASLDMPKSGCKRGCLDAPHLFVKHEAGQPEAKKETPTSLTFDALYHDIDLLRGHWRHFLWPLDAEPRDYCIRTLVCEGAPPTPLRVRVYPNIGWSWSIVLDLRDPETTANRSPTKPASDKGETDYDYEYTRKDWGLNGTITLSYDNEKTDLSLDFMKHFRTASKFLMQTKKFIDHVVPVFKKMGDINIDVELPSIELSFDWETRELPNGYGIDYGYTASLSAAPFIGITGKVDILDWTVVALGNACAPSLGNLLKTIKKRAAEGFGTEGKVHAKAEVAIELEVGASISGDLTWEKPVLGAKGTASGEVTGEVPISIRGRASAEAECFLLGIGGSAKTGAEIGGKSALTAELTAEKDDKGVFCQGRLGWEGIVFYYSTYYSVSFKTKVSPSTKKDESRSKAQFSHEEGEKKEEEVVLVEPRHWPDNEEQGKFYIIGGND